MTAKNHASIVERARRSLGLDPDRIDGELKVAAEGRSLGLPARLRQRLHADGMIVSEIECALGSSWGFDGERGWMVDMTGWPGALSGEELEVSRLVSDVWSGRWALPRSGLTFGEGPRGSSSAVSIGKHGSASMLTLTFDEATGLPRCLEHHAGYERSWCFDDWRPGPWGLVAHRMISREEWISDEMRVSSVERAPAGRGYGPPEPGAEKTRFRDGSPEVEISLAPRGRLPLVRPRVNGREVGPFLLDTGAAMMGIDERLGPALGLEPRGRTWVQTADGGAGARLLRGSELSLGPMSMSGPVFLAVDLAAIGQALGVKLAGVCGYDVFARGVCRLGRSSGSPLSLSLFPAGYSPEGVEWHPMPLDGRVPHVRCESEGGAALLALDTGSSAPAMLYPSGARAWGLPLESTRSASARGLTGTQRVSKQRLAWLSVAGRRVEKVEICVSPTSGPGADPSKHGTLGWSVLRALEPWLDYGRARFGLTRSSP